MVGENFECHQSFPIPIGLKVSDEIFANSWVMVLGATDHITHSSYQFNNYNPCPNSRKIATTAGSFTTVTSVEISKLVLHSLKNVLHVPKLSTNLVSIQKLTQDLGCNVIFYPTHYVLQDQHLGKIIGLATIWNGLHYLETPSKSFVSLLYDHHLLIEKIWLHHHRLGHPSFRTLKILFPSLFRKLDVESIHSEVCKLAKHKRSTFSINNKRSLEPFHLIHSDISGPSLVPNIYGSC